jgi:hypothetical protein
MENGRREVLVVIEERDPSLDRLAAAGRNAMSQASADMTDTSATATDTGATVAPADDYSSTNENAADEVQQTMLALHEDRIRRTDLAIMAYQQSVTVAAAEARRAVTRSRVAWSVAGVATAALFLGATWATHRLTQATADVSHLADSVRQLTDTVNVKSSENNELRLDSQTAKVSAARAEGELAAAKRQVDQLLQDRQLAEARLAAHMTMADASGGGATTQTAMSASASAAAATTRPALSASATAMSVPPTTQPTPGKP